MFISQVCCSLVVCLLASACDRWSCADLHLHARTPSVHLSQVLLFPLSSLLCFAFRFCFVLFVLFSISHSALHVLHLYFGTFCLCLYLSRCVCKRVCVFSWIMSVLFPDEALASSPLSFCFWNPSIFAFLLNPWAFFFWAALVEVSASFCFPCLSPVLHSGKPYQGGCCSCFVQGKETTALEWVREHVEYDLTMWPNGQITPRNLCRGTSSCHF